MELIMIELPIALYETQYVRYQHAIGKSFQSTENRIHIRNPVQVTKAVKMPQMKSPRVSLLLWKNEPDDDITICSPTLSESI